MKRTILRLTSILAVAAMVGVACTQNDELNENSNNSAEIKVEVTTADATDIESKSAKLSATCTITDAEGAKALSAFYYATTNWNAEKIKAEGIKVLSDSIAEGRSTFNATIEGLESATQYYFVASVTINGKDYFGQVKSFITLEIKPVAVDLGLSVKWASFNVDASKPEEYGGYYAWGEVETKTDYSWETYKWCNGTANTLTKYCNNSEYGYNGYTDDKYVLDPEDDVAHVKWGGDWRMPTREELKELTEACSWTREIRDSIDGVKITGPNGNSIFIPAAGYYSGTEWIDSELHNNDSRDLDIWTSTPGDNYKSYFLWLLTSSYLSKGVGTYDRYRGWSVRPVCPSEEWLAHITISLDHETIMLKMDQELRLGADVYYDNESYWPAPIRWTSDNPSVATVNQDGMITAKGIGICTVSAYVGTVQSSCTVIVTDPEQATDYENGYAFVDLGLSVKWATYNVGATSPKEFGDYFAWGETDYYYEDGQNTSAMPDWKTGKSSGYDWASYKWCMGTEETLTKYNMDSSLGTVDDKIQLDLEDDVANIKWGGKWRLPSHDELCELCDSDNCIWIWSSLTNEYSFKVNGYLVISKKTGYEGVSIFLPAIGFRYNTAIGSTRSYSYYWSSSVNSSNPLSAWSISFSRNYYDVSCNDRYYGLSVRPVCP